MTIRLKMLLAIMFTVFLTIAGVLVSVSMQMRTTLTSEFHSNSKAQLERMNSFVDLFFSDTMATAEYLGRSPAVLDNVEHLTSYLNVKEDVTPIGKDLPLGERQIYDELTTMASVHPAYQMIYVGHSNAGFTQTPDTELGAGYNPAIATTGILDAHPTIMLAVVVGIILGHEGPDRLGRLAEGGIVVAHLHLGHHRCNLVFQAYFGKLILQGHLQLIADGSLGIGNTAVQGD